MPQMSVESGQNEVGTLPVEFGSTPSISGWQMEFAHGFQIVGLQKFLEVFNAQVIFVRGGLNAAKIGIDPVDHKGQIFKLGSAFDHVCCDFWTERTDQVKLLKMAEVGVIFAVTIANVEIFEYIDEENGRD